MNQENKNINLKESLDRAEVEAGIKRKNRAILFKNWWLRKFIETPAQEMKSDDEEYELFLFQNNINR